MFANSTSRRVTRRQLGLLAIGAASAASAFTFRKGEDGITKMAANFDASVHKAECACPRCVRSVDTDSLA
jgi:hypothetical protein